MYFLGFLFGSGYYGGMADVKGRKYCFQVCGMSHMYCI
jgi:hypothetical protein